MHELSVEVAADPVALGSEAAARATFTREVTQRVAVLPYLLAAPVTLRVSCPTRPVRAEGLVEYPNLAIWLAPLLDALAGAGRLLLSTSQVSDIQVTTTRPSDPAGTLVVTVIHRPDQRLSRADLRLVAFDDGWCAPVPSSLSTADAQAVMLGLYDALAPRADGGPVTSELVDRGFLRRSDLAADVPVVPAESLLGGPDGVAYVAPAGRDRTVIPS
jgi:ribosomal protein L14